MNTRNLTDETQSQPITPFALRPPILPNWTTPVVGYDGGIRAAAIEGGLAYEISPWLNMAPNDAVDFYWGNESAPIFTVVIKDGEENKPVRGFIDAGHIINGDVDDLFYIVRRVSQAPEESTPRLKLLVKLDRPGGYDDDLNEPGHSHLRFSIPQAIIDKGVGPDEAKAGVPVTIEPYPFMRVRDRIHFFWGPVRILVVVTQEQANDPANHPLIVMVDEAHIEQAGDNDKLSLQYQVIDEVNNYPDPRSPWSAVIQVLVDLQQNRLEAPIVIEANPLTDVIHLDELGENDVEVVINTPSGDFKVNDKVLATWVGTPAEGSQVIHGPIELTVTRPGIAVSFMVPNAKVRAIAKGRATASYVLKSPGNPDRPSKNATVTVEGDISQLQPPRVLEASAGQLPANAQQATISVPYYPGRHPGDLIIFRWEGTAPGGGRTYFEIRVIVSNEAEGTPIERTVPNSEITPLNGGTVKVHYTVANDDIMLSSVRDSLPLNLTVGEAQADLPKPEVPQAPDDVLLPENVPGGVDIIAPFTGTLAGDTVGLRWVGSISGAHPLYEVPLNSHTAGYPVPFQVDPSYAEANRNGTVNLDYYVKRAGQPLRYSLVRTLSIGVAQPKWAAPQVHEAPSGILDPNTYQSGFTVRVDTTGMQNNDGIDLIIEGRPGEGSVRPERRYVQGQAYIDFPIAASITGANIGKSVSVRYDVVRASGPLPSEVLQLQIGTLSDLPTPKLEGFDGESLNIGQIKDATQVLCAQWPFQQYGAPVWVSYIETRTDGTTRTLDHLVGVANNQIIGLAVPAAVHWLRECGESSTVSIVLNVGLFQAAMLADAVVCPLRVYKIHTLFDDLTTFTDYEFNDWKAFYSYLNKITEENGEYYLEPVQSYLAIEKKFDGLKTNVAFELSFDYYIPNDMWLSINEAFHEPVSILLRTKNEWTHFILGYINTRPSPSIVIKLGEGKSKVDNIRLRQTSP